jgi:hypothetical protein
MLGTGIAIYSGDELTEWVSDSFESLSIVDRFSANRMAVDIPEGRVIEVEELLAELQPIDYLVGQGLGGTIADCVGLEAPLTPTLHISIMNSLLKFGLMPFLVIVLLLYVRLPVVFARAIFRKRATNPRAVASLICYPAAGGATSLMLMSGGYTEPSFLMLGVLYSFFVWTAEAQPVTPRRDESRQRAAQPPYVAVSAMKAL